MNRKYFELLWNQGNDPRVFVQFEPMLAVAPKIESPAPVLLFGDTATGMKIADTHVEAILTFGGVPHHCIVPYHAMRAVFHRQLNVHLVWSRIPRTVGSVWCIGQPNNKSAKQIDTKAAFEAFWQTGQDLIIQAFGHPRFVLSHNTDQARRLFVTDFGFGVDLPMKSGVQHVSVLWSSITAIAEGVSMEQYNEWVRMLPPQEQQKSRPSLSLIRGGRDE